mgnify:FL=1
MTQPSGATWRHWLVYLVLAILLGVVAARAIMLQVLEKDFLIGQGDARMERVDNLPAGRGMIVDRHGEPLAVSTPLQTLWADPRQLPEAELANLAKTLKVSYKTLKARHKNNRAFMYLKRHMVPHEAEKVLALKIKGVYGQAEYKRFYPTGEVAAHLLGLTNVDDQGQEGLELAYDHVLAGSEGKKRVLKDLYGNVIRDIESIKAADPGSELRLSIDVRLQYLAYRELKTAVAYHGAKSGSVVILDVSNGDILALVNQPSFNPNNRQTLKYSKARNRAVTDPYEPGSVIKPLTLTAALESGKFNERSVFNTAPGYRRISGHTIRDISNYGKLTLSEVLIKSSNIGASTIALKLGSQAIWQTFHQLGLGQTPGLGLPGEAAGQLPNRPKWRDIELATLSYGHGLTVTPLQLAVAYGAIANQGKRFTPRLVLNEATEHSVQAISPSTASRMTAMLERVVKEGSGKRAISDLYRLAGKTGTAHKVGEDGYSDDRYVATFAGFAPVSDPKLVMVVVVDEPTGTEYYGGEVAAPVFGRIMESALQQLQVKPDQPTANSFQWIVASEEAQS